MTRVAKLFWFLFSVFALSIVLSYHRSIVVESSYCILLDLGSAGSRAYLMKIDHSLGKEVSSFPSREPFLMKTKPGVSSFFPSSNEAFSSLEPLLDSALARLQNEIGKIPKIPLYAFATAGLRVLAEENNELLEDDDEFDINDFIEEDDDAMKENSVPQMLLRLRDHIETKFSNIFVPKNGIRILSGTEEGLYGWITQQQLIQQGIHTFTQLGSNSLGNILSPANEDISIPAHHIAAIDIGGASTQITFWVPKQEHSVPSLGYQTTPIIGGANIGGYIYTHSYLHYGIYQSRYSTIDNAIAQNKRKNLDTTSIPYPCLLKGSSAPHYDSESSLRLEGSSEWSKCRDLVRSIFHWNFPCLHAPCSFNGIHMPKMIEPHTVIAFDYATVIAGHLGFHGDSSLDEIAEQVEIYCSITWEEAQQDLLLYPKRKPTTHERLLWRCYEATYLLILFTEGYSFTENNPHLVFTRELNSDTISWALGAVVSNA